MLSTFDYLVKTHISNNKEPHTHAHKDTNNEETQASKGGEELVQRCEAELMETFKNLQPLLLITKVKPLKKMWLE